MEYFTKALSHYADFSGRATRKEYWMFILFYVLIYVGLMIIDGVLGTMLLSAAFSLGMLIPSISCAARRLHDTGRSGWWQLLVLIPLIGALVVLFFLVQPSQEDNDYGKAATAA